MRKINCFIAILLLQSFNLYSQTVLETRVEQTPWGNPVLTYINDEAADSIRELGDSYYRGRTSGVYLYLYPPYSSSDKFNCHGWAWYMSEAAGGTGGSDPRDIGLDVNNTIPYITDGISYKQVDSASEADIVWWSSGAHSAITTETPGVWISKFQYGPLVEHAWNDTPYSYSAGLEYYKRCFVRVEGTYTSSTNKDFCKAELYNVSLSPGVDLTIEFEDWILIKGTFSTGTGATMYLGSE